MSKRQTTKGRRERQADRWMAREEEGHSRPKSNRKHLKELDRELQRFIARITNLESRLGRERSNDGADLALEGEELHREALLLRAEIREALATGRADLETVVDGVDSSWEQLLETFDELKETLGPRHAEKTRRSAREPEASYTDSPRDEEESFDLGGLGDDEDLDLEDEDLDAEDPDFVESKRIHRPRTGPKR